MRILAASEIKYFEPRQWDKARDEEGSAIPEKGPTFGPATPDPHELRTVAEDCYLRVVIDRSADPQRVFAMQD